MKKILRRVKEFFLPLAFIFVAASFSGAYFSDTVSVTNNSFVAGTWTVTPTATVSLAPSPVTTPSNMGEVVINELMWSGSDGNVQDEWIELKNTTSSEKIISNWQLTGISGGSEDLLVTIPGGSSIPAGGFYLISRKVQDISAINVVPNLVNNDAFLSNSALKIALYRGDWTDSSNLVDIAGSGGLPLAGSNSLSKKSMSRNSSPGDGMIASSWFSAGNNSTTYWDSENGNYGTPGGLNE